MYKSANEEDHSNDNVNIINDLDLEITWEEVLNVIKSLKKKSPGLVGLISLVKIFNVIFSPECYPKSWSEGVITPIHIKGNLDDVNSYRGITLINIMSKIYSHILHNRLIKWAEEHEKINECQFGFQSHKSTVDLSFYFTVLYQKLLVVVKTYIVLS